MPKARIVVVEDEPAIRRGVVDALRLTGYDVTEAADGAAGLRRPRPAASTSSCSTCCCRSRTASRSSPSCGRSARPCRSSS